MIVVAVMLIGMMCVLAYTLAIYALPFMLGLAAMGFAYGTGSDWLGAGIVGLVAGAASFGILTFLFATLRPPILRIALALIFAAPAARAGICACAWRDRRGRSFAGLAATFLPCRRALVGAAAVMRLATSAGSQG